MQHGFLISFEGGEGGGKSTQVRLLKEHLEKEGFSVLAARDNGGTEIGEHIRSLVLAPERTSMSFRAEALLLQASRAQSYEEVVLPGLKSGTVVLMDRTRDSSVVYQGLVRGFGKAFIEELNNFSTQETLPNLTFLLDVDVKTGMYRREQLGALDRFEIEKKDFHEKIRQAYLDLAKINDHDRWVVIDANQSLEAVEKKIWEIVDEQLQ
ncbi:MAG TPA: dTMP kinase [Patescibacteria group bacterium]|nr:dTMP kinase [Patescibacteria group bacterium]